MFFLIGCQAFPYSCFILTPRGLVRSGLSLATGHVFCDPANKRVKLRKV